MTSKKPLVPRTTQQLLRNTLKRIDPQDFLASDPLQLVHQFGNNHSDNQALIALIVALCAYGSRPAIIKSVRALLETLPCHMLTDWLTTVSPQTIQKTLPTNWYYRFYKTTDILGLLLALQSLLQQDRSLLNSFTAHLKQPIKHSADTHQALYRWFNAISQAQQTALKQQRLPYSYGSRYLLGATHLHSPIKRGHLFLKWMSRCDGADIGCWGQWLSPQYLVIPLDTHVHHQSLALGLTQRKTSDATTAFDITQHLSSLNAADPLSFDYALMTLGLEARSAKKSSTIAIASK
jgi:uncharacterized protein (TIGR02757 family)